MTAKPYTITETPQEAYDKIHAWFAQKGVRKAVGSDDVCRYRQGRRRCAVGVLIPDDAYRPEMDADGKGLMQNALIQCSNESTLSFLYDAQSHHDDSIGIAEVREAIDTVAREHGLEVR